MYAATVALLTGLSVVGAALLLRRFLFATRSVPLTPAPSVRVATLSASGPRRTGSGLLAAAAEEQSEPRAPDDFERLLSYREEMFRSLRFNQWQAVSLAECGCDWHEAERLLKKGCPHETVLDLLLP